MLCSTGEEESSGKSNCMSCSTGEEEPTDEPNDIFLSTGEEESSLSAPPSISSSLSSS